MNTKTFALFLAVGLTAAGCAPSDVESRLGVVEQYGDPAQLGAPSSATAGESFVVDLATYGGGCVTHGRTDVSVAGLVADVRPYDLEAKQDACTLELVYLDHSVGLTFAEPGVATVRVHGLREGEGLEVEDVWELQVDIDAAIEPPAE